MMGRMKRKGKKVKENLYWKIQHFLSWISFRKGKTETAGRKRGAMRIDEARIRDILRIF